MSHTIYGILVSALVATLATVSVGCGGETDIPPPSFKGRWLVLKCKLKGLEEIPEQASKIDAILNGPEGLKQYYHDISYGQYTPQFDVIDWVTQKETPEDDDGIKRFDRIQNCIRAHVDAGTAHYTDLYDGVIVMRNADRDSGAAGNVLLDIGAWNPTFGAHEMGHTLGLGHSWDTSDRKNSSWSSPGEYFDPWDIMIAMAVYDFKNVDGLNAGPDMDTSSKMKLGWIPEENLHREILEDIAAAGTPVDVTLDPYSQPDGPNVLAAVIERADPSEPFYTVEFRTKTGWDRAIPKDGVLIHRVERDGERPYVMPGGAYQQGGSFDSGDGLKIEIIALESGTSATIRISKVPATATAGTRKPTETSIPALGLGVYQQY